MQIKIYEGYRKVVAICDTDLIGKEFTEGKMSIKITEQFYSGEEKTEKELLEIIKEMEKEDATFNIIGNESINTALKSGIIKPEGIIKIQKIPIALSLL